MAGNTSAASASVSMPTWALTAVRLNSCFSRPHPPTIIAAPMTSRQLPMIEPTSDAFTTSCSPSTSAKKAMISSGALPKVTFRRPPIPGPVRAAIASVDSPITAAHGITARAAADEDQYGARVRQLQGDRDRDEHPEVVDGTHGARNPTGYRYPWSV